MKETVQTETHQDRVKLGGWCPHATRDVNNHRSQQQDREVTKLKTAYSIQPKKLRLLAIEQAGMANSFVRACQKL